MPAMQTTARRFSPSKTPTPLSTSFHRLMFSKRRISLQLLPLCLIPLLLFLFLRRPPAPPPPTPAVLRPASAPRAVAPPPQTRTHTTPPNLTAIALVALSPHDLPHLPPTLLSLRRQAPDLPIAIHHAPDLAPACRQLAARYPDTTTLPLDHSRPYHAVLHPLSLHPPHSTLYVLAGTRLAPHALNWLADARARYASSPDVAAFFLDGAKVRVRTSRSGGGDHRRDTWRAEEGGGAFLYQLCVGGAAFIPNWAPGLDVWATFAEWLTLRRSDWYRYPGGVGVDGTPLGLSEVPERNWTRAAWNVWFSKFMAEYGLYALYSGEVLAEHARLDLGRDMSLGGLYQGNGSFGMGAEVRRFRGDGSVGGGGKFAGLAEIVELGRRQGGVVSFTMVNKVFLDTARSWLCNVDGGGFRPKGLVWAVTDVETRDALKGIDGTEVVMLDEVHGGKETGHEFGNPGYWKLMLERTELIGEILRSGIDVFAFETDAIWLEDPAPYIEQLVRQDADIVGTINTRMEVSGNFFYLRSTLATRRLWDEIISEFDKAYNAAHLEKKEATSWTYIENDQSQLTKLVLRNETWRRSYPLSFLTLDMERFTDGRWYSPEEGFYTSERARKPVVINNNFVIGVDVKTERAKKWGHWFWDEKEKKCLNSVVQKAVTKQKTEFDSTALQDGHDGAHGARGGSS